jgi:hypothetical protein
MDGREGVKEHPILFSAPMVRAILEGRKTMTRRVVKQFPRVNYRWGRWILEPQCERWMATVVPDGHYQYDASGQIKARCPYGQPGDRLWVRETWAADAGDILFRADLDTEDSNPIKWRPSIFMPRSASRLLLEVTAVRVERVQDISEEDAKDEGVTLIDGNPLRHDGLDYSSEFTGLWDSINAKRGYGWDSNPWVWVVSFKRIEHA